MSSMSIGQLAQQAGVAIDTVRYYERSALLAPAGRMASGYRRYGSAELKRLRFIRRAKALGFSLDDIRELLALGEGCSDPSSPDLPPAFPGARLSSPDIPSPPPGARPASTDPQQLSPDTPPLSPDTPPPSPNTPLSSRPKGEISARPPGSLPAVEMTAPNDVAAVKRAAQRRLADVEARIAELERMRDGLRTLVAACPGHGRAEACPILNALAGEGAE